MAEGPEGEPSLKKKWSNFGYKVLLQLHFVLLCVLIIIVWCALSLPIVFFNIPPKISITGANLPSDNTSCSEDPLTTGICQTELTEAMLSHNCSIPETGMLITRINTIQIQRMLGALELLRPNEECRNEIVPLLCLYFYGLCRDSGVSIQPTYGQCVNVRDNVCRQEWIQASNFRIGLPNCAVLPSSSEFCATSETDFQLNNTDTVKLTSLSESNNFECRDGFYREENSSICWPNCHTWFQYSRELTITSDVAIVLSAIVGVLVSIIVITLSCLFHSRMLEFPSVFILYMVIDTMIVGATLIVSYIDRNSLYCSSLNLLESIRRVTPFCVISGIILEYISFQLALWWLFHIIMLFLKLLCPFNGISRGKSSKIKYLHITFVLVGITLPLVPIITSIVVYAVDQHDNPTNIWSGGLGFGIVRFPPILCYARDGGALFYSFSLPIVIIVAVGCTMLLIIVWSLHRQHIKTKMTNSTYPVKTGKAEIKLFIVCFYYIIFVAMSLTSLTLSTRNFEALRSALWVYFFCEQGGRDPDNMCSRDDIERLTHPFMASLSFIFIGLFPVVNLIYVVNIQETKDTLKKWKFKRSNKGYGRSIQLSSIKVL